MVKISILYPNLEGSRFDFQYYTEKHMARAVELLSKHAGFQGVSVERGLGGVVPGSAAAYVAMCHFQFVTVEQFIEAFMPHAPELQGDMINYTDIEPVIQFNDVLMTK